MLVRFAGRAETTGLGEASSSQLCRRAHPRVRVHLRCAPPRGKSDTGCTLPEAQRSLGRAPWKRQLVPRPPNCKAETCLPPRFAQTSSPHSRLGSDKAVSFTGERRPPPSYLAGFRELGKTTLKFQVCRRKNICLSLLQNDLYHKKRDEKVEFARSCPKAAFSAAFWVVGLSLNQALSLPWSLSHPVEDKQQAGLLSGWPVSSLQGRLGFL